MSIEISELRRNDVDVVTQLYIEVFAQQPWNENNNYDDIRRYIERLNKMNTNHCYLYKQDDQIIGAALGFVKPWHQGIEYQLDNFFVSPAFQKKGYGSEFLKAIKADMHKIGVGNIILETNKETPAEHFYLKHGFLSETNTRALTLVCDVN